MWPSESLVRQHATPFPLFLILTVYKFYYFVFFQPCSFTPRDFPCSSRFKFLKSLTWFGEALRAENIILKKIYHKFQWGPPLQNKGTHNKEHVHSGLKIRQKRENHFFHEFNFF